MLQYRKFTSAPDSKRLRGLVGVVGKAFLSAWGQEARWQHPGNGLVLLEEVLTVKQTASIDHVCALHQRLRSPLIPFRNGETSLVGRGWSPEILNMQTTGKIQCRGSERGKKAIAIGTVLSSALGWLSPSFALSPPRSQHLHHDALITPGRRPPP